MMQTNEIAAPLLLALVLSVLISVILAVLFLFVKKTPKLPDAPQENVLKRAVVLCSGLSDRAQGESEYQGYASCASAKEFYGGPKTCKYGCLGLGDCAKVCPEKAIRLCNGIAVIDRDKCTGCGLCKDACPQKLIRIYPKSQIIVAACAAKNPPAERSKICAVSCIGCGICEKICAFDAIRVVNGTAKIDPNLCVSCGKCAEYCPKKCIRVLPQ